MFKRVAAVVITTLTIIVTLFDFKEIIDIKNATFVTILYILLICETIIVIYFISLFIINRKKNIIIDKINMVAANYVFDNYRDIARHTKNLEIQSLNYIFEFKGKSYTSIRTYKGKSIGRIRKTRRFPIAVSGDHNCTFNELNCYAYDLITDREKRYKQYPNLMSHEGQCKYINYNFTSPLKFNQEFNIEIYFTWPDCVSEKKDYIFIAPIFRKQSFDKFNVELRYYDKAPVKIIKYEVNMYKKICKLGELPKDTPQNRKDEYISFTDNDIKMNKRSQLIYIFYFEG